MAKNAVCVFDFTISKSKGSVETITECCKRDCKKWMFQQECGEGGYEHFQGRVSLKVKSRTGPKWGLGEHWSVTSSENHTNEFYVCKQDTRVAGPWSDRDTYIPRQVRDLILLPWQQSIIDDKNNWNTRNINCVICKEGNIGKSTLVTYAGAHKLARRIPMLESYKDFMRMVMDCPKSNLYLVDFPRSMNKTNCAGFWSAIETVKDGYAYDDRYGFREEYFDCPNIWVFMNTEPDLALLSRDRWVTWEVTQDTLKRCNTNCVTTGTSGTLTVETDVI